MMKFLMINKNVALCILVVLACTPAHQILTHDLINHIQTSLSDTQIQYDVKSMHQAGKSVAQTIEDALRQDHAEILLRIQLELGVTDDEWQNMLDTVEAQKRSMFIVLYSKENIHTHSIYELLQEYKEKSDPKDQAQWEQLRIVTKNSLLDFGINPHNIFIFPNDTDHLRELEERIQQESSWWKRQAERILKGFFSFNYSLSPIWCTLQDNDGTSCPTISFNMTALSYFEPSEQRAIFGHEITHLIEGHLQEQKAIAELEFKYAQPNKSLLSQETAHHYLQHQELVADILPAIKNLAIAQKCSDAMFAFGMHWPISNSFIQPLRELFSSTGSTHPLTFYRRRAFTNIGRYLTYEEEITQSLS